MYKIVGDKIHLKIYAKPNAKKSALVAINDQGINIALHAKPVEDAANKELFTFLANLLEVPKSQISLIRGATNRHKWVEVPFNDKVKKLLNL